MCDIVRQWSNWKVIIMTTYYYAIYGGDYYGFYEQHKSNTMKNALAGLRKALMEKGEDAGVIATESLPRKAMSGKPKGYVGVINRGFGKKKSVVTINGHKIPYPKEEFFYYGKGKRKGQIVMSDGSLRPYDRK